MDKDVTPPSGLVNPVATPPQQQPAWQPATTLPPQNPSSSDAKIGGALLASVHGNIGQQYSGNMGFQGQPSQSQLATFNANAAASSSASKDTRRDDMCQQMEALEQEHLSLV